MTLADNRISGDVFTPSYAAAVRGQERRHGQDHQRERDCADGADAGNYSFNTTASATADITALA